ncbi:hypothetical protein JTE90_003711 [Oedothorax gibbosus]|uniref:Uncharacterized protein n=1 Tax=Oedothorax gibbosus TaxID=931172 RepID=A0AAV6VCZ6_9ARAC|nr:hypothetical protein JTE90_003711 [Oedothorax gibbosus]
MCPPTPMSYDYAFRHHMIIPTYNLSSACSESKKRPFRKTGFGGRLFWGVNGPTRAHISSQCSFSNGTIHRNLIQKTRIANP